MMNRFLLAVNSSEMPLIQTVAIKILAHIDVRKTHL